MASLSKNILGDISGKVGNIVVRNRYGKEVVYSKPSNVKISNSDKAVAGRNKFAITVKLARLINSNPELTLIWKSAHIEGSNAYQKIIKYNNCFTSSTGLTEKNIITPPGFALLNPKLIIRKNSLRIETQFERADTIFSSSAYFLFTSNDNVETEFVLIQQDELSPEGNYYYSKINLDKIGLNVLPYLNNFLLLFAIINKDPFGKITGWSNTISLIPEG